MSFLCSGGEAGCDFSLCAEELSKTSWKVDLFVYSRRKGRTWTLQEGIFASAARPPATPRSLAAVVVPTIADRFGARTFIRELTYMNICKANQNSGSKERRN